MARFRKLFAAWTVFLVSEIVAVLIIVSLCLFEIDDPGWNEKKSLYHTHVVGMPVTMVIVNGHGMVAFRLLPGIKTKTVKYIHGFIHTLVIFLLAYLCFVIYQFKNLAKHDTFKFGDFHTSQAYLTMIAFLIQWCAAVFVYVYLYSNQRRRKMFAAWHNILGIFILQLSIATSCCMLQYEEHHYTSGNGRLVGAFSCLLLLIYGLLINILVLNPILEWPLVGPL